MGAALRILVVEDEALIAMQLEDLLVSAGHRVVGIAASAAEALRLAVEQRPDLALVDIHLADGPTGVSVVQAWQRLGLAIATLFVTANIKRIPEDFAGAIGAVGKPHTASGIHHAVGFVAHALIGGAATPPAGLHLAPAFRPGVDGRYPINRASATRAGSCPPVP